MTLVRQEVLHPRWNFIIGSPLHDLGGKLLVGDVFLETTLNNIRKNGKIAVSASNGSTLEGYQIKGTAEYITEGPIVDTFKKLVEDMFKGAATAKGALIITPERVIVTTPGADNKKEL